MTSGRDRRRNYRMFRELERKHDDPKRRHEQALKHREDFKKVTSRQKMEYENRFLLALHSVTAGEIRFVELRDVWSSLSDTLEPADKIRAIFGEHSDEFFFLKFSQDLTPHALRIWLQRKCISLPSELITDDGTDLRGTPSGTDRLSLTADGRDLCMRAVEHGGSMEAMKAVVMERFEPIKKDDTKLIIHGDRITFINQPSNTVIRDFQNTYMRGDGSTADQINAELKRLVELSLSSRDLPNDDKEGVVQAVHAIAEQVHDDKVTRLTFKGTLEEIKAIVVKASDIAGPALTIIAAVLKLAGFG
jgi:hypothetical protein